MFETLGFPCSGRSEARASTRLGAESAEAYQPRATPWVSQKSGWEKRPEGAQRSFIRSLSTEQSECDKTMGGVLIASAPSGRTEYLNARNPGRCPGLESF